MACSNQTRILCQEWVCRGRTMGRATLAIAGFAFCVRVANYYPIPNPRDRERGEGRNDRSSAANWPASKSDSIRPLARSRSSFSSEWAQNSISLSLSHNLRYFTAPLTLFSFASSSSSSVLTKMISFTFVHLNAAMVCPPPPPPSRSL